MYTVSVRDHCMIAHSFEGEVFGPAQALHGATYVIDAEFRRADLGPDGIVVDIGRAQTALAAVLAGINYRNLDEHAAFAGRNSTTEVVARYVFDRLCERIAAGELGPGSDMLASLRVVLHESHAAWVAYEGEIGARGA